MLRAVRITLVLYCVTFAESRAQAPESAARHLSWSAPGTCPDREAVWGAVVAALGPGGFPRERNFHANATVREEAPGRWRLEVASRVDGVEGHRLAEVDSCERAAELTALVLALAIRPPSGSTETTAVDATSSAAAEVHLSARLLASALVGALPRMEGGGGVAVAVDLGRARGEVFVETFAGQEARGGGPTNEAGAQLRQPIHAGLRGCWSFLEEQRAWAPQACAGGSFGRVEGGGIGVSDPRRGTATLVTAFAGPALQWWPSRWLGARASAELGAALMRPSFAFEGQDPTFQSSPWVVRAEIGVEARFR